MFSIYWHTVIRISIILAHYRNVQKLGKLELDIRFIHYSHISIYDAEYNLHHKSSVISLMHQRVNAPPFIY